MTIRVGINGFGRIGRVALRIIEERRKNDPSLEVVAINDLSPVDDLAHLLKYDSVHRRFPGSVKGENDVLTVNEKPIKIFHCKEPSQIPWRDAQVDVVLEATGRFLNPELARGHLTAGAKKVLLSAPAEGGAPDATICFGVNNHHYQKDMTVVSTASCTTNCIAPIAKVLNDNLGIKKSLVTTIHSYTNDQRLLDLAHKDKRRARAAALSMIPTTTGAAKAVALVLPELEGKFQGLAIRVPTPNVSLIDMVCEVGRETTPVEINSMLEKAALGPFKGVLDYTTDPIVSVDVLGTSCSSIVDSLCTQVVDRTLVKILAWYDNEWGFTNRAVDLLKLLGSRS